MSQIEKLVGFIEDVFRHAPSDRYEIKELDGDSPILLDNVNRVRIVLHPQSILASRYNADDGKLMDEVVVEWTSLTRKQRERIVELLDVPDDIDEGVEDSLNTILKGV